MSNYGTIRARVGLSLPEWYWSWKHRRLGRRKAGAPVILPPHADSPDNGEASRVEWEGDFPPFPNLNRLPNPDRLIDRTRGGEK